MDENRKRDGAHRRLIIVFLLLLFGGLGYAAWFGADRAPLLPETDSRNKETAPTVSATVSPPSFDVLRAEPSGALIAAGRSEPNATVNIMANGKVIGSAKADAEGEWVLQPETPLAKGDHMITLEATAPGAQAPTPSEARVAVSIAGGTEQPLVTVMEEGKPTEVVQIPAAPQMMAQTGAPGAAPQTEAASATQAAQPAALAPAAPQTPALAQAPAPVQTPAPASQGAAAAQVAITQTDYDENGTSRLYIKGVAGPGQRVSIYVDNVIAGMVVAGPDGRWSLESNRKLASGEHTIRADALEAGSSRVVSRAEADFAPARPAALASAEGKSRSPEPPASAESKGAPADAKDTPAEAPVKTAEARSDAVASASGPETGVGAQPGSAPAGSPESAQPVQGAGVSLPSADSGKLAAAVASSAPAARAVRRQAERRTPRGRFVVVRRGDTLWDIAQRRYGRGYRYTRIYRSNRNQIRDPNLIYPNQRIMLPN